LRFAGLMPRSVGERTVVVMRSRLGAHVGKNVLLEEAASTGSEVVQLFLSSNRSWSDPSLSEEFLAACASYDGGIYVHAPYLVNPASSDPGVRERSRRVLRAQTAAAARIGALGVVVHGGHVAGRGSLDDGVAGWLEVLDGWEPAVPILIENTAGGDQAMARDFDVFARLFDALVASGHRPGVCLDTCHAWAGGEALLGSVDRLRRFAGAIDLLHVNDSRDGFGSARDRHANLGSGEIPIEDVLAVVALAGCDAVVETPNGAEAMAADLTLLRSRL
jgi:deoxyribonuclease-4